MQDTHIYQRLAHHLDELPGGFPASDSGIELRILRRLFTEDEAALAVHLTVLPERPHVVALRAGLPLAEVEPRLAEMARKGLCAGLEWGSAKKMHYVALQYVIGIWELQVASLTPGLVADMKAYMPTLVNSQNWGKMPQLRTIPVGSSVEALPEVMPYEQAEDIVRHHSRIVVAPCICRKEKALDGEPCSHPEETCLVFGMAADLYTRNKLGRAIDQQEALEILQRAEESGLVLQPGNSRKPMNICCCCGCCCGVLRNFKSFPNPSELVAAAFRAHLDEDACIGCGKCVQRCQMDAIQVTGEGRHKKAHLQEQRCIGCGLCVSTCPTGALSMERREKAPVPPANSIIRDYKMARARGKLGPSKMARLLFLSKVDRVRARGH